MNKKHIEQVVELLSQHYGKTPMYQAFGHHPFQFLVAVMLSARSRDAMTIPTAQKLFALASTPQEILILPSNSIESILHPIGFYRTKTKYLRGLCEKIITDFGGHIPTTFDGLVSLPGVSRKVAHVVLGEIFHRDVIAVDTHVHRISNRLGWVATTKVEKTEEGLRQFLPQKYWNIINGLLVQHGQQICLPLRPRCLSCPIARYCAKIGVEKYTV
jgi:endonuclease-3